MMRLLRSDYKKFFQDKLCLVIGILAVAFALLTPLLYAVIMGMGEVDELTMELLTGYVSAKGQFFSAFSFGNNLGLIAPLLVGIILFKDFSFGTIRNKIIGGHSRTRIFLSLFTVCFTTLFGIVLLHAFLTLGVSLPFFDYQATPFGWADFWYFLESLLFELLVYLFVSAFISWLCVTTKNVGLVIVLYIAVVFGCTLIGGILQVVVSILAQTQTNQTLREVLEILQWLNPFNASATIGIGTAYHTKEVLYYTLPPLTYAVGFLTHGLLKFNKKDLK